MLGQGSCPVCAEVFKPGAKTRNAPAAPAGFPSVGAFLSALPQQQQPVPGEESMADRCSQAEGLGGRLLVHAGCMQNCSEAMEVNSPLAAQQAAADAGGSETATAHPPLPSSSKVKVLPARCDLNYEATASNGVETLFSQLQAHNGGYKPAAKDTMAVLDKVEFITNARMQSDQDRGFYVPVNTKATHGTTILGSLGSGAVGDADSRLRRETKAQTETNVSRIMGSFNRVPIRDMYRFHNPHLK